MGLGDIVDELLNQHRLADACAAEQADLAAARVGRQKVDHLDACYQDLGCRRLLGKAGRGPVDRRVLFGFDRTALVDRLSDHVQDTTEGLGADRHVDRAAAVLDLFAAHQALGAVHRDRANLILAEMLRHLQHQTGTVVIALQRVQDRRQIAFELHVHHRTHHLGDRAHQILGHRTSAPWHFAIPAPTLAALGPRPRSLLVTLLPWRR